MSLKESLACSEKSLLYSSLGNALSLATAVLLEDTNGRPCASHLMDHLLATLNNSGVHKAHLFVLCIILKGSITFGTFRSIFAFEHS